METSYQLPVISYQSDIKNQKSDIRNQDHRPRKIDYLRVSVTDRCNLRCIYCMPSSGVESKGPEEILSYEEIEFFVRSATAEGISKVRITGGEPLIRRDLPKLVKKLTSTDGLIDVSLTTNGILLKEYAQELFDAGLRRINISLDSLDPSTYRNITRGGSVSVVLEGIKAALDVGFSPVKINTVVLKGMNDNLSDFVKFAHELPVCIRFIECMSLTGGDSGLVPSAKLVERLERFGELVEAPPLLGGGPAKYFKLRGVQGTFGFISSVTGKSCGKCTRLRLTSCGELKICLFSRNSVDVRTYLRQGCSSDVIKSLVREQVARKASSGAETVNFGERVLMSQIGG